MDHIEASRLVINDCKGIEFAAFTERLKSIKEITFKWHRPSTDSVMQERLSFMSDYEHISVVYETKSKALIITSSEHILLLLKEEFEKLRNSPVKLSPTENQPNKPAKTPQNSEEKPQAAQNSVQNKQDTNKPPKFEQKQPQNPAKNKQPASKPPQNPPPTNKAAVSVQPKTTNPSPNQPKTTNPNSNQPKTTINSNPNQPKTTANQNPNQQKKPVSVQAKTPVSAHTPKEPQKANAQGKAQKTQAQKTQAQKTQAQKTQAQKTQAQKTQAQKTQAQTAQKPAAKGQKAQPLANKNAEKTLKKMLPFAYVLLPEQSRIDFAIGLNDIGDDKVRLSDYSILLVPPFRALERLIFDLQRRMGIEVKMIGQAYEKLEGKYALKAGYRKRISSIIYNEVMSALYTEYFEKRNFYAHSDITGDSLSRVISDKDAVKTIFNNMVQLIEYNVKKLMESKKIPDGIFV